MFFKKRLILSQSFIKKELSYRYNFFRVIIKGLIEKVKINR